MKDGLHLYSKTFDPNAPDYNLIGGFIQALTDYGNVMTGNTLASIKFEDENEVLASYLILERKEKLLLAILARIEKEKAEKEERKMRRKADLFLNEFLEISASELLNPVIDTAKYSFTESLVYTFFFREAFEKLEHSTLQKMFQIYEAESIVIGLNQEWKGRYTFYKNDPSFLEVVKGFNQGRLEELLSKMSDSNLYISVQDFVPYMRNGESSDSSKPDKQLTEVLVFLMKKGILELFTIHM